MARFLTHVDVFRAMSAAQKRHISQIADVGSQFSHCYESFVMKFCDAGSFGDLDAARIVARNTSTCVKKRA